MTNKKEILYDIAISYNDSKFSQLQTIISDIVTDYYDDDQYIFNLIRYLRVQEVKHLPNLILILTLRESRIQEKIYSGIRDITRDLILSPDDLTDMYIIALVIFKDKKYIPTAIKNGVADAFLKFDEHTFTNTIFSNQLSVQNLIKIVHPKSLDMEERQFLASLKAGLYLNYREDTRSYPTLDDLDIVSDLDVDRLTMHQIRDI